MPIMKEKKKRRTKHPFLPSFILFSSLWYDEGEEEEMYSTHFSIFFSLSLAVSFILSSSLWYDEGEEEKQEMHNTHFSCLIHI